MEGNLPMVPERGWEAHASYSRRGAYPALARGPSPRIFRSQRGSWLSTSANASRGGGVLLVEENVS